MNGRQIDAFLKQQGSPLAGYGEVFVQAGKRYGVDPRLLVAISGAESAFGRNIKAGTNNPFGWGPHIPFGSFGEAIDTVARGLRKGYIDEGRTTIRDIGSKWAPIGAENDPTNLNSNWSRNVTKFFTQLGGRSVASRAVGAAPAPLPPVGAAAPALPQVDLPGQKQAAMLGQVFAQNNQLLGLPTSAAMIAKITERFTPQPSLPGQSLASGSELGQGIPNFGGFAPKPGKDWGGSQGVASQFAQIGLGLGLKATSEKRDRRNTTSGNPSDHWTGSKDAYAYDLSNGSAPTAEMDAAAKRIAGQLGVKWNGKGPLEITRVVDGYRVQVLYRTNTGGNHFNHIHVGVRRV